MDSLEGLQKYCFKLTIGQFIYTAYLDIVLCNILN